jgi:hypothetical protein
MDWWLESTALEWLKRTTAERSNVSPAKTVRINYSKAFENL